MTKIRNIIKSKFSSAVENLVLNFYPQEPTHAPIFILGLPRSGTTLLYQYLVYRLKVSYFMNGTDNWPNAALLNTLYRYKKHGEYVTNFNSTYGYIPGYNSPHEAGNFWGNFFGYHDYIELNALNINELKKIKRTISGIEKIFGTKPFINKNVKHLLRISSLNKIFPNAIFIVINRDPKDVAISLLRGRYKNNGNASEWWSVKPPNWRKLNDLEPSKQIAHQIFNLEKKLSSDLQSISNNQLITLTYSEFCQKPELIVQTLHSKFNIELNQTEPVNFFHTSINTSSSQEESKLITCINELL